MILEVTFKENAQSFKTDLGEIYRVSDGGYERGLAAGKQAEWDAFWDAFQKNGSAKSYQGAFRDCWKDEIFKPKYDLRPTDGGVAQMFQTSKIVDLKGCLKKQGVVLDTSKCTIFLQMFQSSSVKYIPIIDASNCISNNNYTFSSDSIISIEKLIVSEKTIYGTSTFDSKNLETVTFEGVIGQNGLNLSRCVKLSYESLMSVINCLKDYSGTGTTYTVTLGAANLAKLTDAEKAIATQKGWSLA